MVTELPGPEARRGHRAGPGGVQPVDAAGLPAGAPAGAEGCVIEDVDGNRFLDLNAGIAVNATGHCHPEVVAAIEAQARSILHYCSSDFYLPVYGELCERLARSGPVRRRAGAGLPVQLGHRGGGGRHQAGPLPDPPPAHRGLPRRVPRPHPRLALADGQQGALPGRLRPAAAGRPARPLRHGRPRPAAGPGLQAPGQPRTRWRPSWSSRSRARAATSPRRPGFLAGLRDAVRRARDPAGGRRDPERRRPDRAVLGHRARRRGAGRGAGRQGPGQRPAPRRHHRPGRADDLASGTHGSTFGGNPVSCAAALATIDLVQSGLQAAAGTMGERFQAGLRRSWPASRS